MNSTTRKRPKISRLKRLTEMVANLTIENDKLKDTVDSLIASQIAAISERDKAKKRAARAKRK